MDPTRIPLFDLAERRLAWVDQRQQLLAQNIANADTPGWRARDLVPFATQLAQAGLAPVRTSARDVGGGEARLFARRTLAGERAPDGNGVQLDAQLAKVADTESIHDFVDNVYKKYMGLFRTAIGR
ncbi:MAG: flagellar biosynthesis protein FlgB [Rhodospirillales bacterium]|nr:flagellar biosynthesis protein FlgB [Rhodospirillales bacterium]MDE2574730.1 flagellar biosynthesis protein FlgB [Rhodospirillales bacterium]